MIKQNLILGILLAVFFSACKPKQMPDPIELKVDSLLVQMTLDEKIGQMTQLCFSTITLNGSKNLDLNVNNFREAVTKYHVGSFLSGSDSIVKWVNFITNIQKVAINETRLHIPLIIGIDHVHGANYVNEGTILPHNLNISCSFDTEIIKKGAKVTAIETADLGLTWNFAPVLDIGKNPYWPRLYETFGEDPYLCSVMGTAFITSYENCPEIAPYKLAACAKHFIGYSDPRSGWDRTPSEIPWQVIYEQFIPSFRSAIDNGVKTFMINSGELNGEPVHGSKRLLTGLLRNELGFKGVILTDIKDIKKIVDMHAGADNEKEATLMAINAGIDMSMACNAYDFCTYIKELVQEGKITEERINESVRRILRLKFELGLFDNPYPRSDRLAKIGCKEHRQVAKEAALASTVLLKNENVLPIPMGKKILVTGLAANSKQMLNGAWTFDWLGAPEERQPKNMNTLYSALAKTFDSNNVTLFDVEKLTSEAQQKDFAKLAKKTDYIIVTVGERPYSEFKGNINDLTLDAGQSDLVLAAVATGKPVIVMLFEGRPRIIARFVDTVGAILFTGYPGIMGADAIAELLSGTISPAGKLSFTYPAEVGHQVPYYYKKSEKYLPLYPFGHGLSYTSFEYSGLQLSDSLITRPDQEITATVYIKNTGQIEASEAILWYVKDEVGTITRPDKKLCFFEKDILPAGIRKKYTFKFKPIDVCAYPDEHGSTVFEKGKFSLLVAGMQVNFYYK